MVSPNATGQSGGGRLAYVGLSGGFGTLTIGQIWSASYNSVGAITDNSIFSVIQKYPVVTVMRFRMRYPLKTLAYRLMPS